MADALPAQVAAVLQQANEAIVGLQQQVHQQQHLIEALQTHPAGPAGHAAPTRLKPNKPDTYDGRRSLEAAENFVFQHEEYFAAQGMATGVEDALQISFAAANLRGQAALWYRERKPRESSGAEPCFQNWADFASQLKEAFRPFNACRLARDRLAKAFQRTSVQEFVNELRNIRLHLPSLSDDELLDRFLRGLKYPIRKELAVRDPTSFEEAARIAERLDVAFHHAQSDHSDHRSGSLDDNQGNESTTPPPTDFVERPSTPSIRNGASPMEIDAIQVMNGRNSNRKCYLCGTSGHFARDCPKLS